MKASDLQAIGDTLFSVVTPDMTPKQLLKAVQNRHPDASKKDIVRAAFFSIIQNADGEAEKARKLHAFAIRERG